MAKIGLVILLAALLFLSGVPAVYADGSADETADGLLVDYGNGRIAWYDIAGGSTVEEMLSLTLPAGMVEYVTVGTEKHILSVGGQSEITLGSGMSTQTCSWRIYSWNSVEWEFYSMDAATRYYSGSIALGFYPEDSLKPASNPDYREVWTAYRADSTSSGVSQSFGPEFAATPLEWYNTYAGPVDSNILYVDGMIYHTVSGKYGSVGMDALARINCLDPVNKTVLWSVTYSNSGNTDITTPVIVGDLIIITSGNWHIYCLDRFTGEPVAELAPTDDEGDMCGGSKLTTYITRKDDPSVNSDRFHLEAGFTNAVYDSGALYFCTSDGLMRCFSVDRENGFREIWSHPPENEYRGCFYYHPPVIGEHDGVRFIIAGNYGGGLICKNAITGDNLWAVNVQSKAGNQVGQVSSVSLCSDGRALVCYSEGEMSSAGRGIMLIDVDDGAVIWQKEIKCSKTTVVGDRFYAYVAEAGTETVTDSVTGEEFVPQSGYYSFWVNDCSMFWKNNTEALCTGGLTYCQGRLYSIDYSPGTQGALGGWVWCLDSDTGSTVWKVRVTPYSGNSYCMNSPTVVDGKVMVGNDYGAIYVISETAGSSRTGTSDMKYDSEGIGHWSWTALFIACVAVMAVTVLVYRRAG